MERYLGNIRLAIPFSLCSSLSIYTPALELKWMLTKKRKMEAVQMCKEGKWNQGKLQLLLPLWQLHAECTLIFLFWVSSWFWSFSEYDCFLLKMRSLIIYVPWMRDHCSIQVSGHWCAAIRVKCFHVQQATIRTLVAQKVERIVCLSCPVPGSSTCQSILDEAQSGWMLVKRA